MMQTVVTLIFNRPRWNLLILLALILVDSKLVAEDLFQWTKMPSLPDSEGFAGPFAGTHQGALIVAGGANFPDKMPWEGGTKIWYDRLFVLDSPAGSWKEVGKLPRPLGYGVSVSGENGVVCIGGSDANQHYRDCFQISWLAGKISLIVLPALPKPCANSCGALLNNTIYVAGGLETPTSTATLNSFWSLDLSAPKAQWQELPSWPGPARMLATAAVHDDFFYLCSGVDLVAGADGQPVRKYLRDAYRYTPGQGWMRIADLPRAAAAAPTPAPHPRPSPTPTGTQTTPTTNTPTTTTPSAASPVAASPAGSTFCLIGGDDGRLVDFIPMAQHPGFPRSIQVYHPASNTWTITGDAPFGLVTTTTVHWHNRFVIPSGEIRPGKRSPAVWSVH